MIGWANPHKYCEGSQRVLTNQRLFFYFGCTDLLLARALRN